MMALGKAAVVMMEGSVGLQLTTWMSTSHRWAVRGALKRYTGRPWHQQIHLALDARACIQCACANTYLILGWVTSGQLDQDNNLFLAYPVLPGTCRHI
jgi:hypothetical protein